MRSTIVGLALVLALAGCTGERAPSATHAEPLLEAAAPEAPAETTEPTEVPIAPPPQAAPRDAPEIVLLDLEMDKGTEVALANGGAGFGGPYARVTIPEARPSGATIVVMWEAQSPASEMTFRLYTEDVDLAAKTGASPIVIEVPAEAFGDDMIFGASLWPASSGVYVEGARLVLTLVY